MVNRGRIQRYWGGCILRKGDSLESAGNVADEVILGYIWCQERDFKGADDFKID